MKLLRINDLDKFFGTYPTAFELFKRVDKKFFDEIDNPPREIDLGIQRVFEGNPLKCIAKLKFILFQGPYEVYCYEIEH